VIGERTFQLAQINVARMRAPLDDPSMKAFVDLIAPINALAEASPGFVWRLRDPNATLAGDPTILVNLSVWDSVEALKEFTYRSGHIAPFRARTMWFEPYGGAHLALWWIPAGTIPTIDDGAARLASRDRDGDTPAAFSFANIFRPSPE
jgi:hypothetical protein